MIQRFAPTDLSSIAQLLKQGGVFVFPTETSYGIGCDATNDEAVAKVFAAKGRPEGKGTPVLVQSLEQAKQYVLFSKTAEELAKKHWPGALNIILPTSETDISSRCATDETQSVRVSPHPFIRSLFDVFDRPLVATSANPSGSEALYDVSRLEEIFGERAAFIDGVVDIGPLPVVPASTTVRIVDGQIEILRQGSIVV